MIFNIQCKGAPPIRKQVFFRALPKLPPPPPAIRATCTTFLDVKNNVLALITEPSKDDYDNDVSDICDHNFGTFDDFGVKNDQQVSHYMILMSKYIKRENVVEKRVNKFGQCPPPPFWAMPERNRFFSWEVFPNLIQIL